MIHAEVATRSERPKQRATPKLLFTVPETCESLGISRSTLYNLISQGKIPVVKIGIGRSAGVRFRPTDLQDFADAHLVDIGGRA